VGIPQALTPFSPAWPLFPFMRGQSQLGCVTINVLLFSRFRTGWHNTAALTALFPASIFADRVQVITEPLSVLSARIVDLVDNWVRLHVISLVAPTACK